MSNIDHTWMCKVALCGTKGGRVTILLAGFAAAGETSLLVFVFPQILWESTNYHRNNRIGTSPGFGVVVWRVMEEHIFCLYRDQFINKFTDSKKSLKPVWCHAPGCAEARRRPALVPLTLFIQFWPNLMMSIHSPYFLKRAVYSH